MPVHHYDHLDRHDIQTCQSTITTTLIVMISRHASYHDDQGGHNGGLACLDIMTIKVVVMVDWHVWIS